MAEEQEKKTATPEEVTAHFTEQAKNIIAAADAFAAKITATHLTAFTRHNTAISGVIGLQAREIALFRELETHILSNSLTEELWTSIHGRLVELRMTAQATIRRVEGLETGSEETEEERQG